MTDTDVADKIYIEPLNVEILSKIIRKEKPDGLLPTMGGQTGLNLAQQLAKSGILDECKVEVLGTSIKAIEDGEDREKFKNLMKEIEEPIPESAIINSYDSAKEFVSEYGYPVIIRPAYTLGGAGGGIAYNDSELKQFVNSGLTQSMIDQVLLEQAIMGTQDWGEFEMEVMRDKNDNCIIICPMENFDPMGIHTGESIVVAPTQTLNDHDFQVLRTSAIKIIRALKVEGGCNIQFAMNYKTGDYMIVEVNPRVSRSSALASKATGYPIARIAAKIAIGMTLDEIPNDVTKETKACFEPTIDYVVVKIPRWPFDKFDTADKRIGTQMKSTGETMAIGRTFEEALQKAIRSLEVGRFGLGHDPKDKICKDKKEIVQNLKVATHKRMMYIRDAMHIGISIDEIHHLTGINKWFLTKVKNVYDMGKKIKFDKDSILDAKRNGFSDVQIATIVGKSEDEVRKFRIGEGIIPTYKMVDTCAAEFKAYTPYMYSTYEEEDESNISDKKKVILIGGGPIRIGQGIEFDYCCVHSVFSLREMGIEAQIINNNPETVSTDFDTSDKLYFEPLTFEDVMNVIEREKPYGVIVQFGGQTPINMAMRLHEAGVNILGTSPESIDMAEDRKRFGGILDKLKIPSAEWGTALSISEALEISARIGYPVLVRPSFVLGGRAMKVVDSDEELKKYMKEAASVSPDKPVLVDKFLGNAIELDVDALCDGKEVYVAAIMEHIEEAGVHSGDSACVIPPQTISAEVKRTVIEYTTKLAKELKVIGLMNIQYAIKDGVVYILEANPRASRTVPYVSKTIGIPLAKIATKLMMGKKLSEFGLKDYKEPNFVSVKEAVFPFIKLSGVDPVLGPEMKSTGEVMGIDSDFGKAYYKAQAASYMNLPKKGNVLLSIGRDRNKDFFVPIAKDLVKLGFDVYCTEGTQEFLSSKGINAKAVPKVHEDPKIIDMMKGKKLDMIIIIPSGSGVGSDGYKIRRGCVEMGIPYVTTKPGTLAYVSAIKSFIKGDISVDNLEDYYKRFN
jgi:carbamoyl-phosphate synthase large subunit